MNAEQIHRTTKKKTEKISRLAATIAPDFNADTLHDFRVAVKKLRSFMRLVNSDKKQPQLKLPKKFKQLYDIAGIIRDTQLQQKKIATWEYDLPTYRQHLIAILETNIKQWNDRYITHIADKLQEKLTDHKFVSLSVKAFTVFFNQWMAEIHKLCDGIPNDDNLHSIRKHIKDLLYNTAIVEKKWPKAYKQLEPFPLPALDILADMIGDYNDERLMREHLLTFNSEHLTKEEQDAMTAICEDASIMLQQKKRTLLAEIRKFLTAAPTL